MVVPLGLGVRHRRCSARGAAGFGLFITALGFGVAVGVVLAVASCQRRLPKERVFTLVAVRSPASSLIVAASMSTLAPAALVRRRARRVRRRGLRARLHAPARERRRRAAGPHLRRALHARAPLPADRLRRRAVPVRAARPALATRPSTTPASTLPRRRRRPCPGVRLTLWLAGADHPRAPACSLALLSLRAGRIAATRPRDADASRVTRAVHRLRGRRGRAASRRRRAAARSGSARVLDPRAGRHGARARGSAALLLDPATGDARRRGPRRC